MPGLVRTGAIAAIVVVLGAVAAAGPNDPDPDPPGDGSGSGSGAPAVVVELHDTVQTKTSRAKLSVTLIKPAEKAAKARDWARAIPLYQAIVVARGPGSAEAKQLATLWTLAGQ